MKEITMSGEYRFFVRETFTNYEEFKRFKDLFEKENSTQLYVRSSHRSDDNELKYSYLVLNCKAGGKSYESVCKSKGIRKSKTLQQGCPFKVTLKSCKTRKVLIVSSLRDVHTCSLAGRPEIFKRLPKQRRPNEEEKKLIIGVKECGGNTKDLIAKLRRESNKLITGKDVNNCVRQNRLVNRIDKI